jgi:hypothetical protein
MAFRRTDLLASFKHTVTLRKTTRVSSEDVWTLEEETYTEYSIRAHMEVLTLYDLTFLPIGMVEAGDTRGYFLPYYITTDGNIAVNVDDTIIWKGHKWRVYAVYPRYNRLGREVYREAYMRMEEEV